MQELKQIPEACITSNVMRTIPAFPTACAVNSYHNLVCLGIQDNYMLISYFYLASIPQVLHLLAYSCTVLAWNMGFLDILPKILVILHNILLNPRYPPFSCLKSSFYAGNFRQGLPFVHHAVCPTTHDTIQLIMLINQTIPEL